MYSSILGVCVENSEFINLVFKKLEAKENKELRRRDKISDMIRLASMSAQ